MTMAKQRFAVASFSLLFVLLLLSHVDGEEAEVLLDGNRENASSWPAQTPPDLSAASNNASQVEVDEETVAPSDFEFPKLFDSEKFNDPVDEFNERIFLGVRMLIILSAAITLLNMALPVAALLIKGSGHSYQPILFTPEGIPQDPRRRRYGHLRHMGGAITFTVFFLWMIISGAVFIAACDGFTRTLEDWIPSLKWGFVFHLMEATGAVVMFINTFLLVFLWLQAWEMKLMIQGTYEHLIQPQDKPGEYHVDRHLLWNPRCIDAMFRCSFALLFLSMLLSLICFVIGVVTIMSAYVVVNTCNTTAERVSGFCLDLEFLGLPRVKCGLDFRNLCYDWSNVKSRGILLSGFFVFVTHFYLVAATGFASHQRRSMPAILNQYVLLEEKQRSLKELERKYQPPEAPLELERKHQPYAPLTLVEC